MTDLKRRLRAVLFESFFLLDGAMWFKSRKFTSELREQIDKSFLSSGRGFRNSLGGGTAYRRVSWGLFSAKHGPPEVGIWLSALGRLGNLVIQLGNVLAIADLIGSNKVYFRHTDLQQPPPDGQTRPLDITRIGAVLSGTVSLQGLSLTKSDVAETPSLLWRTSGMKGTEVFFKSSEQRSQELSASLRGALGFSVVSKKKTRALTLHLRGGDIFGPRPHRKYGQPPWGFYKKILELSPGWEEIRVVTEDSENPCLALIVDWCYENGRPVKVLGANIDEAVVEIATARNLVTSRGTFVPAIVFMYPADRNVFYFGAEPHALYHSSGTSVFIVEDLRGFYEEDVLRGNWSNTGHQRFMMKHYGSAGLSSPVLQSSHA
ncbi:hypothetical protein N8964_00725 [Pontimonas sp.]|nr:hypothetical protein [Pontimonas sp.]